MGNQDLKYLLVYWVIGIILAFVSVVREEKLTPFHIWYIPLIGALAPSICILYGFGMTVEIIVEYILKTFKNKK